MKLQIFKCDELAIAGFRYLNFRPPSSFFLIQITFCWNPPKKILSKKSSRKIPKSLSKFPPKIKKIIANIALIGQNPFRACFFKKLTLIRNVKPSQNEKVREGSWEKEIVNGAARIFFGPSYFVTALVQVADLNFKFGETIIMSL